MSDNHFQDIFGIRLDATPSGLISDPPPHPPFLHRMPFLTQPSGFILAWDSGMACTYILRKYPINTHTHLLLFLSSGVIPGWLDLPKKSLVTGSRFLIGRMPFLLHSQLDMETGRVDRRWLGPVTGRVDIR